MKSIYFKILAIFIVYLLIINYLLIKSTNKKLFENDENRMNIEKIEKSNKKIKTTNDYSAKHKNDQRCNPIHKNISQEYTIIDGVRYPKSIPLYLNKSINFECLNKNKIKRILLWESFYNLEKKGILKLGERVSFEKQNCPVTNCELTMNRTKYNESDFVLIHMWDKIDKPPTFRPPNQRWVFLLYESPRTYKNFTMFKNMFNLTSTYKIDSDFPGFYESSGTFYWHENKNFNENFNFSGKKTKLAAAVSILIKI